MSGCSVRARAAHDSSARPTATPLPHARSRSRQCRPWHRARSVRSARHSWHSARRTSHSSRRRRRRKRPPRRCFHPHVRAWEITQVCPRGCSCARPTSYRESAACTESQFPRGQTNTHRFGVVPCGSAAHLRFPLRVSIKNKRQMRVCRRGKRTSKLCECTHQGRAARRSGARAGCSKRGLQQE